MEIEKIATSAVTAYISKTECLSPFINEGDKEPSWDGHIYIYKNHSKKKEDFLGKIPVQVKGTYLSKYIIKPKYKYRVDITDLKNYEVQGIAYFVVFIDKEKEPHIYYNLLCPVDIKRIINRNGNQKGTNIEFKEIPHINDITLILINFISNCEKQASFVKSPNFKLVDIDQIQNKQLSIEINVSCTENNLSSLFEYIFSNEVFLYEKAQLEGYPNKPIDKISIKEVSRNVEETVSVNDNIFYNEYTIKYNGEYDEISIGKCITLKIRNDSSCAFNILLNNSIKEQIIALKFTIELLDSHVFKLGKNELKLNKNNGLDIEELRLTLEFTQNIQAALEALEVQEDLIMDYAELDKISMNALSILVGVLVLKEPYSNSKWENIQRVNMKIFNIYLPLMFIRGKNNEPDKFINELTQTSNLTFQIKDEEKGPFPQCLLLGANDYERISPIYYDGILAALTQYDNHELLAERINYSLLHMLSAFDKNNEKKLLETAILLSDWIYINCISVPEDIRLINKLQAVKRKRALTAEEIGSLLLKIEQSEDITIKTAIYLLLDNIEKANIYYAKMKDKKFFKSLPIYSFMKAKRNNI